MKLTKICSYLVLSGAVCLAGPAFAASYGASFSDEDNKSGDATADQPNLKHYYVDVDATAYQFNFPKFQMPVSIGATSSSSTTDFSTTPGRSNDNNTWDLMPSLAVGYAFQNDNPWLSRIFGYDNRVEVRYAYSKASGSDNYSYGGEQGTIWAIDGQGINNVGSLQDVGSASLYDASNDYDDTYQTLGFYYMGDKQFSKAFVTHPFVGFIVDSLEQDNSYSTVWGSPISGGGEIDVTTTGENDLDSYYFGVTAGDNFERLFTMGNMQQNAFGFYGRVGLDLLLSHNSLNATQKPFEDIDNPSPNPDSLALVYKVDQTDDQFTFRGNAELGVHYYLQGQSDPNSMVITVYGGVEYWNDVPYADMPTDAEQVSIAYDSSTTAYTGVRFHWPVA